MVHQFPGFWAVFEGLDGIGKDTGVRAVIEHFDRQGKHILDLDEVRKAMHYHPDFDNPSLNYKPNPYYINPDDFDVLVCREHSRVGSGADVDLELTQKGTKRTHSALMTGHGYALDRYILYNRVVFPALRRGKTVIQSRNVCSSLVYQPMQSKTQKEDPVLTMDDVAAIPGNAFALEHTPDALIISTIYDASSAQSRLENRKEDDENIFENLPFLMKIKDEYMKDELIHLFKKKGTRCLFLDTGISLEHTRKEAIALVEAASERARKKLY